jgi:hypothetical protein
MIQPKVLCDAKYYVTVSPLGAAAVFRSIIELWQLILQVNGTIGSAYEMQASANLTDWSMVFTTNSPVVPFSWTNCVNNSLSVNFFQVLAGSPLS